MEWPGIYYDGLTSARHAVTVRLEESGLRIQGDGESVFWPWGGLVLSEVVFPGQPTRLRHKAAGEASLVVEDAGILAHLHPRLGGRLSAWLPRLTHAPALAGLGAASLALGVLLWLGVGAAVPKIAHLIPLEWERHLGNAVVEEIAGEDNFCEEEAGVSALQDLTARLLATQKNAPAFRIRTADVPMINAFTAPGNEVLVLQGLIEEAQSAEELAAVLAHELAHGLKRHPTEKLARVLGLRLITSAMGGDSAFIEGNLGQATQVLVVNAYGREDELEADRIGLEMLNAANIRGTGLVTFLSRMDTQKGESTSLSQMFSSHPLNAERIARLKSGAKGTKPAMTARQWKAVKAMCE